MVIRRYSSSFGLASPAARRAGPDAGAQRLRAGAGRRRDRRQPRPRLGHATAGADARPGCRTTCATPCETGYSGNLVVHAFARTAIGCGIDEELIDPFFASMRMDLDTTVHTPESFDRYVYGSAEVVGLMCLRVFLADGVRLTRAGDYDRLAPGAQRLGAAFQKLNFLRDLAEDHDVLRRSLLPRPRRRRVLRRRPRPDPRRHRRRPRRGRRRRPGAADEQPPRRPGRARDVRRARRAARGHPGGRDPPLPRPRARPGQAPRRGRRALPEAGHDLRSSTPARPPRRTRAGRAPSGSSSSAAASPASPRRRCWPRAATASTCSRRTTTSAAASAASSGRLPLRHRRLVVPHARGLRALLLPARHHRRGRARPRPCSTRATASSSRATPSRSTSAPTARTTGPSSSRSSPAPASGSTPTSAPRRRPTTSRCAASSTATSTRRRRFLHPDVVRRGADG